MPKQPKETYKEYKERVIDPVSPSFCAAKWNNATIWLGSGTTASCHHPPAHKISIDDIKANSKALHNTKHKKLMRKQMLAGERPTECEYCWKIEDIGRDSISDRVFKTVIYDDENIEKISQLPWDADVNLETLEIAFDRTCNFACSYCNASFSTTWGKDIKNNGVYQNLVSDGAAAFQQDGSWAQPYARGETNPYVEAFWDWWPELSKSLKELRITGGEPLMSDDVWKLFEYFKENGSNDIRFAINSNLGAKPELIEKLIKNSHYVDSFDLYTSCEAYQDQAEYIRDGLQWDYWVANIHNIIQNGNIRALHMMMTINSLSLFSITDFMDMMLEWKTKYGKHMPTWSVNLLRFPSFMSPLALPDHIKNERRAHLEAWLKNNENHPMMHEMEKEGIARLIDYLDVVDSPHRRVSGKESMWRDFKSFYEQYDERRGKSLHKTFPNILTDWVDSLPYTHLGPEQNLKDGDSTKGWHDDVELKELAEKEGWVLNPESENPR